MRAESQAPESWAAMPASHTGMDIACASFAVQPSSVKIVGMKADILAAVKSQQKNMSVLRGQSQRPIETYIPKDSRKHDLIVADYLAPVRPLYINLLVAFV
jgi:hypothetical protein